MNTTNLLRTLGAVCCVSLASCAVWPYENSHEAAKRDGEGYSLDNPATGSRYMAGSGTTTVESGTIAAPPGPSDVAGSVDNPAPAVGPTPGPTSTVTPAPPAPEIPAFGVPVPGRAGFVYPPGAEQKPEHMVDARDITPGTKVRDPRTGKIFLVP